MWPHTVRMAIIKKSITNAEEDVNKRELSCTVGGNVNEYNHYKEPVWRLLKKLGIKLPHDPANLLLSIYPEKIITQKVPQCSLQHYLQQPECGSNLDVHRQING